MGNKENTPVIAMYAPIGAKDKPTPKPKSNKSEFVENTTENKQTNSEFPIDKPKKKRKYYPRKPKTSI